MWLNTLADNILAVNRQYLMEASEILAASRRIFLIGNGGSAAIASHIAVDLSKNKGIPAQAFNDASTLTCLANDYGYSHVFEKALLLARIRKYDTLIAISSSGQSSNILKGCEMAEMQEANIITLSGFKPDNPLRAMGDVSFYVPSDSYGIVEITHLAILHSMVGV